MWLDVGMTKTETSKAKAKRVPGDIPFGLGSVLSLIGLVLFFVGQSPFAMLLTVGGLLLAILGKLQEIAWNTSPKNREESAL